MSLILNSVPSVYISSLNSDSLSKSYHNTQSGLLDAKKAEANMLSDVLTYVKNLITTDPKTHSAVELDYIYDMISSDLVNFYDFCISRVKKIDSFDIDKYNKIINLLTIAINGNERTLKASSITSIIGSTDINDSLNILLDTNCASIRLGQLSRGSVAYSFTYNYSVSMSLVCYLSSLCSSMHNAEFRIMGSYIKRNKLKLGTGQLFIKP